MFVKVCAVAIVVFVAVVAYVIGSRVDGETISLLSGTLIGIMAATPCASLITYVLVKRNLMAAPPATPATPATPSQLWATPKLVKLDEVTGVVIGNRLFLVESHK